MAGGGRRWQGWQAVAGVAGGTSGGPPSATAGASSTSLWTTTWRRRRAEVRKLSQRAQRKHLELAEAGKYSGGGHRPFRLRYDPGSQTMAAVAPERDLIAEACAACLAGESWDSIARRWNDAGVRTVTGRQWTGAGVRQTLKSPRSGGLRPTGTSAPDGTR